MSTHRMVAPGAAKNAIDLPPFARRSIRLVARFVNPLVLAMAGRRWMPIVGILHHRGRRSGRAYATPLGIRPLGDAFVMPRTFSESAAWYQNVRAAGWATVTWDGANYTVFEPDVVDAATAKPAFPRYERLSSSCWGSTNSCSFDPRPRAGPRRPERSDEQLVQTRAPYSSWRRHHS